MSYSSLSRAGPSTPYYSPGGEVSGPLTANRSRLHVGHEPMPSSPKSYFNTGHGVDRRLSMGQHEQLSPPPIELRLAALTWAESVTGEALPHNDHVMRKALQDGSVLCKLLNSACPGSASQFFVAPETPEQSIYNLETFFNLYDTLNPPPECRFSFDDLSHPGYEETPRVIRAIIFLMHASKERERSPLPATRSFNRDILNLADQDGLATPGSVTSHRSATSKYGMAASSATGRPHTSGSYRVTSPQETSSSLLQPTRSYGSPQPGGSGGSHDPVRAATSKSVQAAAGVTRLMQQCTAMLRDRMYTDTRPQQQLQLTPAAASNRYLATSISSPELPAATMDNLGPVLENVLGSLTQEYEKRLLAKDHELSNARDRIRILEHNLATRDDELRREQEATDVRMAKLQEQAARMSQSDLESLVAERDCLQAQLQKLQQQSGELQARLEDVDAEYDQRAKLLEEDNAELRHQLEAFADIHERYEATKQHNKELYNQIQDLKGSIRVFCRVRPPGLTGDSSAVCTDIGLDGEVAIYEPGGQQRRVFNFDRVFGSSAAQAEVYEDMQPLIRSVLDGYNVCIFAYGQTGSGKTHTMAGTDVDQEEGRGINYRALDDLFRLQQQRDGEMQYAISVQMLEIYNEQLRDLLADRPGAKLDILSSEPSGENVPGITHEEVCGTDDVLRIMAQGARNRATSGTKMNDRSSRSHQVLTVVVRGASLSTGARTHGCLHLVDLAGSERVGKSEATGDRMTEAQHINKSLSALGDVMAALADKDRRHVPYRNSKLTQLLEKSLSGQAKVMMFVHVAPEAASFPESVTTMKFGARVSEIVLGKAKRNSQSGKVFEAHEEASRLQGELTRMVLTLRHVQAEKEDVERARDSVMSELLMLKSQQMLQQRRDDRSISPPSTRQPSGELPASGEGPTVPRLALQKVHQARQERGEALDTVSPLMSARTLLTPHHTGDQSPYAASSNSTPKSSRLPVLPKACPAAAHMASGGKSVDRSNHMRRSSMSGPLPVPPLMRSATLPTIKDGAKPSGAATSRTGGMSTHRPSTATARTSSAASNLSAAMAPRPSTGSRTSRTSSIYSATGGALAAGAAAAAAAARPSTAGPGAGAPKAAAVARASNVFTSGLATSRQSGVFTSGRAAAAVSDRPGNITSRRSSMVPSGWK